MRKDRVKQLLIGTVLWCLCIPAALSQERTRPNPAFQAIEDEPGLPRVLILGDSISIGYTLALREELQSLANVHRPAENCRHTAYALEKIDQWLGDGNWDLIHFNWGLHDLKYVDARGRLMHPPEGSQVASPEQYATNLEKLVQRLRQTGAILLWRPTTPVPAGAAGRFSKDVAIYNSRAQAIMDRYEVEVNDLNPLIVSAGLSRTRPDNVHFTPESSQRMAIAIAEVIKKALQDPEGSVPAYLGEYTELYRKDPRAAALQWFKDARFGLFIHYALASVLDRGKPEYLQLIQGLENLTELRELPASEVERLGISPEERRRFESVHLNLRDRFTADRFDADAICDLALKANIRYVNLTTKHLGRLALYKTETSDFTSLNSPAERDLVAEMAEACSRKGLGLFLYVPPETARTDGVFFERNRTILRELLTQYGPIAGIWFDGIGDFHRNPDNYSRLSEVYAFVRQLQPQCLVSFKEGATGQEDFMSPEHFLFPTPVAWEDPGRQQRWEVRLQRWKKNNQQRWLQFFQHKPAEINTTLQQCFNRDGVGEPGGWINDNSARHLTADELMVLLRVAGSLNSNLLVNVGPLADGSIHPEDMKTLTEVGRRLRQNGFPR